MERIIITEGIFEQRFLAQLLPIDSVINTKFINAGEYSSALSLAKTYIESDLTDEKIICLVVNSDATDEMKIKEKETFIRDYVGTFNNFNLFLMAPKMEALLFESKDLIKRITGRSILNSELMILGKFNPREAFKQLNIDDTLKILPLITETDIGLMLNNPQVNNLIKVLEGQKNMHNIS